MRIVNTMDEQFFAAQFFSARGKPDESDLLEYALSDLWRTQDYSEAKRLEAKFIYYVDDKPHVRKDIDFGENVTRLR
jgi:hypothetical protein